MFGSKSREIARLQQLVAARTQQRDDARALAEVFRSNTARIAQRYANDVSGQPTEARLTRAVRAVARLRQELDQQKRVADRLSDQLMHAMGYTDAGLNTLGTLVPDDEAVAKP